MFRTIGSDRAKLERFSCPAISRKNQGNREPPHQRGLAIPLRSIASRLCETLGRKAILSRWLIFFFVLGFSLGCSQEGNMNTDERERKAKMKAFLESPEYKKAVEDRLALMKKEGEVREEAEWIGKTGLSEELERELPRYLRREFGQSLFDADSIKA